METGKRNNLLILFAMAAAMLCCCAAAFFLLIRPVIRAPHTITKEYIWYCLPHKENEQPLPTEKAQFIKDYSVIYVGDEDEKAIYLTLDDPSGSGKIAAILDALKNHGAKAAFFMTEAYIRKNPKIIMRMAEEGHLVCNHTAHHINISHVMNFKKFKEELGAVEEAYREVTGSELSKYFRPPEGRFSELTLKYAALMGYTTVFWSFCYKDWEAGRQLSGDKAIARIVEETHPGEVIMLHTQSSTNVKILEELLSEWEEMGYRFKRLDEMNAAK
jgi:peptidoglycan-N-acetylmuramic acid deacetylase